MSDYAAISAPRVSGGQKVDVTTTSAQSTVFSDGGDVIVTVSALCFILVGTNPTAVANTSQALAANVPYRIHGLQPGEKIAFVTGTGTATAYISQGA